MTRAMRCTLVVAALGVVAAFNPLGALASTAPGLGNANSYAVLAYTTVTNTGTPTAISGDLGVSPGTAVTGFPPGTVSNGSIHKGDTQAAMAQASLGTAYDSAASSPCNYDLSNQNLGGKTLTPGTYCQSTAPTLTGTLTLSGNGVFIFKAGDTMVTAPGATVLLTNGAQSCNVFWQVSSSATLDVGTTFVGTIMALASVGLNNNATIDGRALARNGAVTLDNNRITAPTSCAPVTVTGSTATPPPTPTPTPTPAATSTATPTATPSDSASGVPSPTPTVSLPRSGSGQRRDPETPVLWLAIGGTVAVGIAVSLKARVQRRP